MGSVITTIFFAEVDTYYDGAKDTQGGPPSNVFIDCDGGRCRSSQQHPQAARRRRLYRLRWWLLLELPTAPPGGPPSTSLSTTMVALQVFRHTSIAGPLVALPELLAEPPGGQQSMCD
jgi:hypothetical protein